MFETLTDRLNETFARLGRKGRLTEQDVDDAMREVRRALLEADVNFKVAKDFVAAVRERAVGQDVLHSLTPAQTVIGIANEELIRVLGEDGQELIAPDRPPQILMLRSAGSGKTTHAAKLAVHLRKQGRNPLLVAGDVYRPAAINQLQALGKQINIPVYEEGPAATRSISPPMRCGSPASAATTRSSSTPPAACRSTTVSCRSWSTSGTACDRPRSCSLPTP